MQKTNPSIILVKPQLGDNIGSSARAMFNFGLTDLRIIDPRDGWPSERAQAMSSGALDKMPPVSVFDDTKAAIADCNYIYATTARVRGMEKEIFTANAAATDMRDRAASGQKIGILFGGERAGLDNEDVALANALITIPANPDFTSINLGQAVLLTAYEWFQNQTPSPRSLTAHPPLTEGEGAECNEAGAGLKPIPAPQKDFELFINRLEDELDACGFFRSPDMRSSTLRNIRSMLARTELTEQEVRTWHGIVSALRGAKTQ